MTGITGWSGAIRVGSAMVVMMATPVMAQRFAVDNSPPVVLQNSDANAALPPQMMDPSWVPPREVVRMLRSTGYDVLSRPKLRGTIFSVAVVTPRGDDGRLFLDARDGRLLRFVPGDALTNRTEEDVSAALNTPAPPPSSVAPARQPQAARTANRAPIAPRTTTAAPAAVPPQTQAAARPSPAEVKPPAAKPPLVIQPTQDMPAVMGLE